MSPPLSEICRYISFDILRESLDAARSYIRFIRAEWLHDISKPCGRIDV
jgi:hypothetical protein